MNEDDRWVRDLRLAHIHGVLVGMKKDLSYEEFTKLWSTLCSAGCEDPKMDDDDKRIFKVINDFHMDMLDNILDLLKDKEVPKEWKDQLRVLAKMIEGTNL